MEDAERLKLLQRCNDAEIRAKTLAECLDVLAGKFAALTAAVVGMRINKLEDGQAKHGARIGDVEANLNSVGDSVAKARTAYDSLRREVRSYGTQSPQAADAKDPATQRPQQTAQTHKA